MTELEKAVEKKVRYIAYHGTTLTTEGMVKKATEDLLALMQDEIRKARIDELCKFSNEYFGDGQRDYRDRVYDRIKKLSKGKE